MTSSICGYHLGFSLVSQYSDSLLECIVLTAGVPTFRQLLVAECYERRSLGITSNLVFSEWERIFANPMATAAAIDPVVHHSVILEFNVPSYYTNAA